MFKIIKKLWSWLNGNLYILVIMWGLVQKFEAFIALLVMFGFKSIFNPIDYIKDHQNYDLTNNIWYVKTNIFLSYIIILLLNIVFKKLTIYWYIRISIRYKWQTVDAMCQFHPCIRWQLLNQLDQVLIWISS